MKILMVGGSGIVGTMLVPYLQEKHTIRVFDRQAPSDGTLEYFQGDVTRYEQLEEAVIGMDAVVYMAMGSLNWDEVPGIVSAFDVNIKGLHLTLRAAHNAGISQAVYLSSMSIYADLIARTFPDENILPDAHELYGFTKSLGETICMNAVRSLGIHVNALRLCFPTPDEEMNDIDDPEKILIATAASDLAAAIDAALLYQGRFQTFMISGDYQNKMLNMSKAKLLLQWEPLVRPMRRAIDK